MILTSIIEKVKEMFKKMVGQKSIENELHISPAISNKMFDAIQLWESMYEDKSPWLREPSFSDPTKIASLGLPAFIASEKARMATLELKSEITEHIETQLDAVSDNIGLEDNSDAEGTKQEKPEDSENGEKSTSKQVNKQDNTSTNRTNTSTNKVSENENNKASRYKLKQTVFVQNNDNDNSTTRAGYLNKQYKKLLANIRKQLEYGIALGGLVIKPYIVFPTQDISIDGAENTDTLQPNIEFEFVKADSFYPISFDGSGRIIEAVFIQPKFEKEYTYTKLEYHKLVGTTITIINKAYKSFTRTNNYFNNDLGQEISLTTVPEWANLEPEIKIPNVNRLLFAYFKMPEANTIDIYSPLGVSGFSRAISLIKEADMQYSRLLWEFEGGELAIDIDRDAFREVQTKDNKGNVQYHTVNNMLQQRLFRKIDLNDESTYNIFSPTLRDTSLINGLNNILMRIEDICALSRGTIADVTTEAKTATELKILKQRSYAANLDIQKSLENALRDVVYIMDVYCSLYDIIPDGDYDVSFEWDDSILVDVESELGKRITLMQNGLTSKVEVRMWYFGETEQQARLALQKISEENNIAAENNMQFGEE